MEKYKKIYVLGSGFSKSMSKSMPSMRELTDELLTGDYKRSKYKELMNLVRYLQKKAGDSGEFASIESISSLILGRKIFYNNDSYLYNQILQNQMLHWIYEKIDGAAHQVDDDKIDLLKNFFTKCALGDKNGDKSLVITFNYDLLTERLVKKYLSDEMNLGYLINLNRYFPSHLESGRRTLPSFQYLKLHGSFNWFRSPGSTSCDIDNVYLIDDENTKNLIHYDDIPVFIPMAYTKGIYLSGSFYNVLWNIAQRYLDMTDEINFIGYGFPNTDLDNLAFFLYYKKKINHIVVSPTTSKRKRLEALFGAEHIVGADAAEYLS